MGGERGTQEQGGRGQWGQGWEAWSRNTHGVGPGKGREDVGSGDRGHESGGGTIAQMP